MNAPNLTESERRKLAAALPDEAACNRIVVRLNNCAANDACALCGERTDPQVGPELFLADTWKVVCRHCGKKHAPYLTELVEALPDEPALFAEIAEEAK